MTKAAAQASAFFQKVARDRRVWTLRDRGGYPAPVAPDGRRVQPFWSSQFRAARMARTVQGFEGFEPVMVSWPDFRDNWLPGLQREGLLVGINWSGARAIGYDIDAATVMARIERAIQLLERSSRQGRTEPRESQTAKRPDSDRDEADRIQSRTAEASRR